MPKLSVVVPFYNVEAYLAECLDSIARQSLTDLEVIMVDDGSPDACAAIAATYAAADPRFRLVRQENQGLGPARNTGVTHATGEYLAFADSDDVLPRWAYARLVGSLDRTGSDLCSGDVRRFGPLGLQPSWLPAALFGRARPRTHVRREEALLWDRSAWNKVFRRSFWAEHGFMFPPGLYEDVPVTLPAHVRAESADVVRDVVYFYRLREGSITARRMELGNLTARLTGLRALRPFFDAAAPDLRDAFDATVLRGDLDSALAKLVSGPDEERAALLALVREQLADVRPAALASLAPLHRVKYDLAARGRVEELRAVAESGPAYAGMVRRRSRWYHRYPYLGDREAGVPDQAYRDDAQVAVVARLDEADWFGTRLVLRGHAYIRNVEMPPDAGLEPFLRDPASKDRLTLRTSRVRRPDVTADAAPDPVHYDWSGFSAVLDLTGPYRTRTWELHATVQTGGMRRTGPVTWPADPVRRWPRAVDLGGGWLAQPVFTETGHFELRIRRPAALLTGLWPSPEGLRLAGLFHGRGEPRALIAEGPDGARVEFPAGPLAEGGFAATLDPAAFARPELGRDPLAWFCDGSEWTLSLAAGDAVHRLAAARAPLARARVGDREVGLLLTRYGNVNVLERAARPAVESAGRLLGGDLLLDGSYPGGAGTGFVLRREATGGELPAPAAWAGDRFRVTLEPPPPGTWTLHSADGALAVGTRGTLCDLPFTVVENGREVLPRAGRQEPFTVVVRPALEPGERGGAALRRMCARDYPRHRARPIRDDLVVFESWDGDQAACSPRALSDRLAGSGLDLVWVSRDGRFEPPPGSRLVTRDSRGHLEALARAGTVVSNTPLPRWFVKRQGQTYLQTWHGTPLKRIGFDVAAVHSAEGAGYLRRFAEDVAKWDALVSPNPFSTEIMRRAFRFDGEILETGYPRNDPLAGPAADVLGAEVRRRLGIPADRRVILYAPTWRDDAHVGGRYVLDLRIDLAEARRSLGDDHVLLIRAHNNVTRGIPASDGFVLDVSGHPDVNELYLAADVLVTDYSSAMFDFAVTGRPIVLFAYDLADYRDRLRGFYLDLEEIAPGPLVTTSGELLDVLRAGPVADYAGFRERFCPFDDGGATDRVLARILPAPTLAGGGR